MATRRKVICTRYDFLGGGIIPATAVSNGPWVKTITGAAPPTCALAGSEVVLALEATSQVQNVCLSHGNHLGFDIDDLVRVTFWARLSVALSAAAAKVRFGMAAARNDDPDAITTSLLFGLNGTSATVNVEADDGTNELAATSTGLTLATTLRKFQFDFTSGFHAQSPPSLSVGGKSKIIARMDNASGNLVEVASSVRLNLGAYTGGLQPFAQIQKTAATDVGSLAIRAIEIEHYVPQ